MTQDYSEYLAVNVLNEEQLVTYRSLSRALKVHCNLAKQMLYEFHRKQNAKKPGTVHATYIITGTRRAAEPTAINGSQSQDDADTVMQSSPPLPGSSFAKPEETDNEPVYERAVLLVKEEHLDKAKATFEKITGIHVYSLAYQGLSDLQTLTECNRKIAVDYASKDPLEACKLYGTIHSPGVRRRTTRTAPPPAPVANNAEAKATPAPAPAPSKPAALEKQASTNSEKSLKETPEPAAEAGAAKKTATTAKPTGIKRESSNLFKAFAKGANQPKKSVQEAPPAAPPQDEPMGGMSEDEPDAADEDPELEVKAGTGKSKREREAELAAMMDMDDEPMNDEDGAVETPVETPKEEAPEQTDSQPIEEPKEILTVENGRRRGRRRIMKKKTVKDEEGYLVTREEAAWESFSEEEPAPKKLKMPPSAAPATGKGAKKGAKPGQGNIMSFFGKK